MLEKYEICRGLFHGFDWSRWTHWHASAEAGAAAGGAGAHPGRRTARTGFLQAVTELSQAFALAVPQRRGAARFATTSASSRRCGPCWPRARRRAARRDEDLDHAIRQIVSKAMVSDEVVDIFAAAGLKKPDISILSDEFLAEVRGMPQRNLAVELLQKLLKRRNQDCAARRNVVQARVVRRNAGAGAAALPEPRHRDRARSSKN